MRQQLQKPINRLLIIQTLITVVVALLWGLHGALALGSALAGGLVAVLLNGLFAKRFFAGVHDPQPLRVVRRFYLNQIARLVLSVALIVVLIRGFQLQLIPLVVGYLSAYLGAWAAYVLTTNDARVTN